MKILFLNKLQRFKSPPPQWAINIISVTQKTAMFLIFQRLSGKTIKLSCHLHFKRSQIREGQRFNSLLTIIFFCSILSWKAHYFDSLHSVVNTIAR